MDYKVGDLVYIQNGNKIIRGKLTEVRLVPFVIKKRISSNIFEVRSGLKKHELNLFHASKLVPYSEDYNPLEKRGI